MVKIARDEAVLMSIALKTYMRVLENRLQEHAKEKDEKKMEEDRADIRACTRLIKKARKEMRESTKFSLLVEDEMRC